MSHSRLTVLQDIKIYSAYINVVDTHSAASFYNPSSQASL